MPTININGRNIQPTDAQRSKYQQAFDQANKQRDAQTASENKAFAARDKQIDAMNRLTHAFAQLEKRLQQPLRPSSFATGHRAIDALEYRINAFQRRTGINAVPASEFGRLRMGMGTEAGAHRSANTLRLGSIGQRFAETGQFFKVGQIDAQLRKIERDLDRSYQFETNPAKLATLQRQKDALLHGRERINSAMEGHTGGGGIVGNALRFAGGKMGAIGKLGMVVAGAGIAYEVAKQVATAPLKAADAYTSLIGSQKAYLDFRLRLATLGRAGGFNSRDLEELILPRGHGAADYLKHLTPTMQRSKIMQQLGLGPADIASNIESTGIVGTSAQENVNTAVAIRRAYLQPGMGLPEQQLGRMLGQARVLGMVKPGEENKFFDNMGKTMVVSVHEGLDRSRTASVMMGLAQQAARNGAISPANQAAFDDFWSRMVSSGAPGMREGSGVLSFAQKEQQAAATMGVGGDTGRTAILGNFIQRHGGMPQSEAALTKMFGLPAHFFSTPASQQVLQDYLQAAKSGSPYALNYLSTVLQSAPPGTMERVFRGSAIAQNVPSYLRGVGEARFTGHTLGETEAYRSVRGTSLAGGVGTVTERSYALMKRLMADIPGLTVNQAAGIVSNLAQESGSGAVMTDATGGVGVAMWTADRRKEFLNFAAKNKMNPTDLETSIAFLESDLRGPRNQYLKAVMAQKTALGAATAFEPYESGGSQQLNTSKYIGDHLMRAEPLAAGYSANQPLTTLNKLANAQAADVDRARYISDAVQVAVTGFNDVAQAAKEAAGALRTIKVPGGFLSGGMYVPNAAVPNDRSGSVPK